MQADYQHTFDTLQLSHPSSHNLPYKSPLVIDGLPKSIGVSWVSEFQAAAWRYVNDGACTGCSPGWFREGLYDSGDSGSFRRDSCTAENRIEGPSLRAVLTGSLSEARVNPDNPER